jgi:hypothetical protein
MAMFRTLGLVERNTSDMKLAPVVIQTTTAADVFPDSTGNTQYSSEGGFDPTSGINEVSNALGLQMLRYEFAFLQIFNAGPGNAYVAFGRDADPVNNFVAYLIPGSQYDIPTRERVSVYASGGAVTIARVAIRRLSSNENLT